MRICAAQTQPVPGNIAANIQKHLSLVELAISEQARLILFSELSLTGYEPGMAEKLATTADDHRFRIFQTLSDSYRISICAGMPLRTAAGITISLLIFQPRHPLIVYSKQHLHADETPFFVPGQDQVFIGRGPVKAGMSICYELSVPEHAARIHEAGAKYYLSSVAKTASGMETAAKTLSAMAANYKMTVLLANAVGPADNFISAGGSSAWNEQGERVGQLDDSNEGILVLDTVSRDLVKYMLK